MFKILEKVPDPISVLELKVDIITATLGQKNILTKRDFKKMEDLLNQKMDEFYNEDTKKRKDRRTGRK